MALEKNPSDSDMIINDVTQLNPIVVQKLALLPN